ncbi:PorT family protein [Hymenobacter lucidus]|uniref:PorT family protein n=1 Tax=Hymenobacter lucidus TaxID=2880930 RepID=A0ABS8AT57_9BACT|nr:PorT family protein [Hymenobacter lucidus]MCB2409153.1 PorT family protein [Hymenobacter lucidus]
MRKSSAILAAFLFTATTASAQTTYRFGVRVGGNLATTTEKGPQQYAVANASGTYSKSPVFAGQLGVVMEVARGNVAFQPALVFSQKGTDIDGVTTIVDGTSGYEVRREGHSKARYHWLELPLNVVYTLPGTTGLQLFAGPYAAVGVGGQVKTVIDNTTTDPSQGTVPPTRFKAEITYGLDNTPAGGGGLSIREFYSRRFDAGFNAGVGYRRGPFQVQAGIGLGLVNLYYSNAEGYDEQSGYNRMAQLTGTYFF